MLSQPLVVISGAVDIRVINYMNRVFVLFSDIHKSNQGLCPDCQYDNNDRIEDETSNLLDVNLKVASNFFDSADRELKLPAGICYKVNDAIREIIIQADKYSQYVDVFIESPFDSYSNFDNQYPLRWSIESFNDCLYNNPSCIYDNARFHYIDMRFGINFAGTVVDLTSNIRARIRANNKRNIIDTIRNGADNLSMYLNHLSNNYITQRFINEDSFEHTRLRRYYDICLESNNYIYDMTNFLQIIFAQQDFYIYTLSNALINRFSGQKYTEKHIKSSTKKIFTGIIQKVYDWALYQPMIVIRDGVVIHRLRAQLLGLENQGDSLIAESIRQYINKLLNPISLKEIVDVNNMQYSTISKFLQGHNVDLSSRMLSESIDTVPLMKISALLMDLYTLARMFRTFPIEYRKEGKSLSTHIPSSYVIEHAGRAHIDVVTDYLVQSGGTIEVYNPIENYERCVVGDFLPNITNIL